jgi:predicted transcriptional regulator
VATTTVRVSRRTYALLHELARHEDTSVQDIVERAVDRYWREQMIQAANRAYAALRADASNWDEYQQELAEWSVALRDGLED